MSTTSFAPYEAQVFTPEGITELVRGKERSLVERFRPLVCSGDVILDCKAVERIDAAGITALICLYASAQDSGNSFHICNAPARVAETLALVGLGRVLLDRDADPSSWPAAHCERSAA